MKVVEFEAVPQSVRGNVKLGDLNTLYTQLTEHFSSDNNRCGATHTIAKNNNPAVQRIINVPLAVLMEHIIHIFKISVCLSHTHTRSLFPLPQGTSEFAEDEEIEHEGERGCD